MDAAFRALREAPLHAFDAAAWERHYPRMVPWLAHADAEIRGSAVERLTMAVFRAEPGGADIAPERTLARMHWLLDTLVAAQRVHPDILPAFLRDLRWHGDDAPFREPLSAWLARLEAEPPPGVPGELVAGARLLVAGTGDALLARLDDPSDYVRSCAARGIGWEGHGNAAAFDAGFLARLTEREIARPGLVGPFWSGWSPDVGELAFDPLAWMLDVLERRAGPEPAGLAFNGIDFHLHELADGSPEAVRRLHALGRTDIAAMAATETRGVVPGMEAVLRDLGDDPDREIADAAHQHLARHYRLLHPAADPARLRHVPGWRAGVDAFVLRQGHAETWRDVAVLYPAGAEAFDDAQAWRAVDAAVPPDLRGPVARHYLAMHDAEPGPYPFGDSLLHAFESGTLVDFEGDPDRRAWRRIEIIGRGLQRTWRPFDWTASADGR